MRVPTLVNHLTFSEYANKNLYIAYYHVLGIEFNICKRSNSAKKSLNINLYMTIYKYQSVKYFILRDNLD